MTRGAHGPGAILVCFVVTCGGGTMKAAGGELALWAFGAQARLKQRSVGWLKSQALVLVILLQYDVLLAKSRLMEAHKAQIRTEHTQER